LPKIWEEAAKNGDKTLMQLLQMGAPKEQIEKYFEQRGAQQDAIAKALAIDKGKTDLRNAEITELKSDPEVRKAAERVYELRSAPPNLAGFAGNNPRNQAIMAVVDDIGVERGKKYDASKWFGKLAAQRVADSAEIRAKSNALSDLQRQRSNVAAFQATNVTNGKRLLQLAEKVDDTGVPVMNRWIRGGRTAIEGDPDTAAFNAQLFLWSTDTAKIVTQPRLTGQLTDAARHEVAAFIPGGATLEQLQSLVGTLNQDANSRITQLDVQINDLTHDIRGLSDNIRSGTLSEQQQFNRKQFKDENGNPVWGVQDPDTGEWRPE